MTIKNIRELASSIKDLRQPKVDKSPNDKETAHKVL